MTTEAPGHPALPLGLYVHLPWCVRKCPYCDFNSHALKAELPAEAYLAALLDDLAQDAPLGGGRPISHIYFGGGTPSLFSAEQIGGLLAGIGERVAVAPDAEITLEANPGTIERDSFRAYHEVGINRVSLGAQSFDTGCLQRIGRIHGVADIETALESLRDSGLQTFNIDLMYALPGQEVGMALDDVRRAIEAGAPHVSHYQLTLEPNTAFAADPPPLPDDEAAWEMIEQATALLETAGYQQYEISAWSLPGHRCAHNLNYWRYGDYLGIGAGAHGKLTDGDGRVRRLAKSRGPGRYMGGERVADDRFVDGPERLFEYFLNVLRLREPISPAGFETRTGLAWESALERARPALDKGLLEVADEGLAHTPAGWRFVNDIQALFLPDDRLL